MSNKDPLHPPADDSEVERQKYFVAATVKLNALTDSNDALWSMVRSHEKLKIQIFALGSLLIFVMSGIQYAGSLYVQKTIADQMSPLVEQVAKINVALEVAKQPNAKQATDVETCLRRVDALERRVDSVGMVIDVLRPVPAKVDASVSRINMIEDDIAALKKGRR